MDKNKKPITDEERKIWEDNVNSNCPIYRDWDEAKIKNNC